MALELDSYALGAVDAATLELFKPQPKHTKAEHAEKVLATMRLAGLALGLVNSVWSFQLHHALTCGGKGPALRKAALCFRPHKRAYASTTVTRGSTTVTSGSRGLGSSVRVAKSMRDHAIVTRCARRQRALYYKSRSIIRALRTEGDSPKEGLPESGSGSLCRTCVCKYYNNERVGFAYGNPLHARKQP